MVNSRLSRKSIRSLAITSTIFALLIGTSATAEDESLQPPAKLPKSTGKCAMYQNDVLLMMPKNQGCQKTLLEEINKAGARVIRTIGDKQLTTWVVKYPCKQTCASAENSLRTDVRLQALQKNFLCGTNGLGAARRWDINDPYFPQQYNLRVCNVPNAFRFSTGGKNVIGVIDSGCNGKIKELAGKTFKGFDAVNDRPGGQNDTVGHGTFVATVAAANTDNGFGIASPAQQSRVYPIDVADSNGDVFAAGIITGINLCGNSGIKIINLSINTPPPFTFANKDANPVLHEWLKWYHDEKGGLVFNGSGNTGDFDSSPLVPYLIVVSGVDQYRQLASFSVYGNPIWFTAPAVNILGSLPDGQIATNTGTSLSTPLASGIAALIWGAHPSFTNRDIERVLIRSANGIHEGRWSPFYGYGLLNASGAMLKAEILERRQRARRPR